MKRINNRLALKIRKYSRENKKPLIILISGVNGIGKTTIAFALSNILGIKQRVGLGTIVKTLIAMAPNSNKYQEMDNNFSCANDEKLKQQALTISKPVNLLIDKYHEDGVSCIIEGMQLFPIYLNKKIFHFHIAVNNIKKYKKQLFSPETRYNRKITKKDLENLLKIDVFLEKQMYNYNVYILKNSEPLVVIINKILYTIASDIGIS
jgi:2-phosphoglycerate kinase